MEYIPLRSWVFLIWDLEVFIDITRLYKQHNGVDWSEFHDPGAQLLSIKRKGNISDIPPEDLVLLSFNNKNY